MTPIMFVLEQRWPAHLRRGLYVALAENFVHVFQDGTLGEFCWLHFESRQELSGNIQGNKVPAPDQPAPAPLEVAPPDALLIRLCSESARRVARWRAEGKRTNDLGWATGLSGHETANLIRAAFDNGRHRAYLRRMLLPVIDTLADAGATECAAELRTHIRRA
jgi:hypothetical protein